MKATVIGCGRWGSFISWYLNRIGSSVTLYGRSSSAAMSRIIETRKNEYLTFPDSITFTTELEQALSNDFIFISVNSQGLRSLLAEIATFGVKNKVFVLCMKGIEVDTKKRLSEIAAEFLDSSNKVAVWLGPGHVQEFLKGIPNCMVIDSADDKTKTLLADTLSSELIRFYYGDDLLGNEIGAAAKNVIGIAAGMLDGRSLSTLKGALMSRGTREIARLIKAMGGNELSAYGLCHLGDYEATVFSQYSHNRMFGEMFVKGDEFKELAEGFFTVKAISALGEEYGVELPICTAVNDILHKGRNPDNTFDGLFRRNIKNEFYR